MKKYVSALLKHPKISDLSVILIIALSSITALLEIKGSRFIQPQEIVFLIFLPVNLSLLLNIKVFTFLDKLFSFYLLIFFINILANPSLTSLIETVGVTYLFTTYLIISRVFARGTDFDALLKNSIIGLLITSISIGTFSVLLHVFGFSDRFVSFYPKFPYLGDVWRINGFTWSNLLLSNIGFGLFFLVQIRIARIWKIILVSVGFCVGAFTLSKELVILFMLFTFLLYSFSKDRAPILFLLGYSGILATFAIVFTFFVLKPVDVTITDFNLENDTQIGSESILTINKIEFYPTTYFFLFKSSIEMIKQNPLFGLGSGRFKEELINLKGIYPESLKKYDTHDFYWGQVAELGLLYVVFLVFFIRALGKIFFNENDIIPKRYHMIVSVTFLFFLICFLVGGSKHYRHLWIFFGIVNSFLIRDRNSTAFKLKQTVHQPNSLMSRN